MKRILITGGAGFIGHHLIEYMLETTDYEIVSLDRLDVSSNLSRIHEVIKNNEEWKKRVKIVWHDLKAQLNDFVVQQIGKIDYILHLAAGSHVDRSVVNPVGFVMDNVVGTTNLLEYARHQLPDLDVFLYFSTDEVFGPAVNGTKFAEDDRHNPCNPYSASKSAAEQICNAYKVTYNMPVITTHTMNVYGIRQNKEKFIPLVIDKLKNNKKILIHSNKDKTLPGARKYLHAKDVSAAMLYLLENGNAGEKYNIASNTEVSNLELAQIIAGIMNKELDYELAYPQSTRGHNDFRYSISGEKMKKMGWAQQIKLEDGLRGIVEWVLENE